MRLLIDTSRVSFTVGREPEAKKDQNGVQRVERNTNIPMWSVQLVAMDDGGAEVINVTVAAPQPPKVSIGQSVAPMELQAIPWVQNGRNGVAYRATDVKPISASKSNASAAS